jgi:hypothetical protein
VPAHNYRDRQTIGQIELVSLILNNRIVELESGGNYADAVPLAIDRMALLKGNVSDTRFETAEKSHGPIFEHPFKDLMDRLFNYGAYLLNAGREEDGLAWAAAASSIYHNESRWQEFIFAVHKTASVLSAAPARDWCAAAAYIEGVIARFGPNRELEQALKTYRGNIAADFHNRFAAAWNKKTF